MKKTLFSVLAAGLLASYAAAETPSIDADDALSQERRENLRLSSTSPAAEIFYQRGKLAQGGSQDYVVNLKAGHQYGIYSDCKESACINLDMDVLFGGKVIRSDDKEDNFPLFTISPSKSGQYTVRPKMTECSSKQCEYHVHVIEEINE